jgi:hypothetical protein
MDAALAAEPSIGQSMPWAKIFLDYTDAVLGDLPDDDAALDYRPTDPQGAYVFSVREQAMHIADERLEALSWITGDAPDPGKFLLEYGGTDKPWQWRNGTRAEIIERAQQGRAALDAWLAKPRGTLFEVTDHIRSEFEKHNAKLLEGGKDISERLARGPAPVLNILLFVVAHEQSHRTVLQHMLRMQGHSVTRYA